MLKKTIKYTDFNDKERSDEFYFNLSKSELLKIELAYPEGLQNALQKIVKNKDTRKMAEVYENILLKSYGEKSEDGSYFTKKDANGVPLCNKFAQTAAYDSLFEELLTDENAAFDFIVGIMPNGKDISRDEIKNKAKDLLKESEPEEAQILEKTAPEKVEE